VPVGKWVDIFTLHYSLNDDGSLERPYKQKIVVPIYIFARLDKCQGLLGLGGKLLKYREVKGPTKVQKLFQLWK